ncbi:beta-lactamase transpeptidase [Trichoderma arundinaceum]|uniref:Beta-lactamase transpeptidase n=1 Tax=Trichoderma arundinaceum TaxID=490622 RepID=A0A395NTM8_TRIAR|nr:beta-lactamase transpeptidase [Trichoderma arundinaceum]
MEKLDAILKRDIAQGDDTKNKLLGAAFVVTNRDGVIYSGSAGRTGMDVDSTKFDGDTLTYGASLTKLLAATCLMQLVEQDEMHLDYNVRQLIPELKEMQILRGFTPEGKPILEDNDRPMTLHQLMTHTVGLRYDVGDPNLRRWSEAIGRPIGKTIRLSRDGYNTPLSFPPGDGWAYGSALDWAGVALEMTTRQTLGEYMKEHVLEPLGMRHTGFRVNQLPHTAGRRAQVTLRDGDSGTLSFFDVAPEEPEMDSAGAGIHTTANDYARMLRALLQAEPGVLSAKTAREMFAPQLNEVQRTMLQDALYDPQSKPAYIPEFPDGVKLQYGYGGLLALDDLPGQRRKGSLSWTGADNSRWWIDPESGIAAVLTVAVFPFGDEVACRLWADLERTVYGELVQ